MGTANTNFVFMEKKLHSREAEEKAKEDLFITKPHFYLILLTKQPQ
jgi:hypothetical protein